MIINNIPVKQVLDKLANSARSYFLTGSCFFGTSVYGSYFDFFTEYDATVEAELSSYGFRRLTSHPYLDLNTRFVMFHPCNIYVQIVRNQKIKQKAQMLIKQERLAQSVCKRFSPPATIRERGKRLIIALIKSA